MAWRTTQPPDGTSGGPMTSAHGVRERAFSSTWMAIIAWPLAAFSVGAVAFALFSWALHSVVLLAAGSLIAWGAAAVGGIAGFLFGLPRYNTTLGAARSGQGAPTSCQVPTKNWLD